MLITARANHGPDDDHGVIGHARSQDLLTWEVQPPRSDLVLAQDPPAAI
jgi:beta-fructofuranosidase